MTGAQILVEEGRSEGLKDGRSEGLREGRLDEARSALRRVVARRGLRLTTAAEAAIDACVDLPTLERWLDDASVATDGGDIVK